MKKYDVEFWKKVLDDFNVLAWCYLCEASNDFMFAWDDKKFRNELGRLFNEWPDRPKSIKYERAENVLAFMPGYQVKEKQKLRIDFLNYLITNKISLEV